MRIAIGGIYHESNSFAPESTSYADILSGGVETDHGIATRWDGTNNEIAGFLVAARRYGWEVIPTLMAWIMPSGPLVDSALETLTSDLCDRIPDDVDGILLVTHGAMVTEASSDPDAWWLEQVRARIGPDVPCVATADYHGNITNEMLNSLDGLIGYDTYPHVDYRERGEEAADLLARMLDSHSPVRPVMHLEQLPVIPHLLRQFTGDGPMNAIMNTAHREERRTDALWVSVFGGFAWADVPHNGLSVVVGTHDDPTGAEELCQALGRFAWRLTSELIQAQTLSAKDAVQEAIQEERGPVVIVDTGDNVGGGSAGDYTTVLRVLVDQKAHDAAILVADPASVVRAIEIGVGGEGQFALGGKADPRFGGPVELHCRVRTISDGIYTNIGEMRDGITDDMGRTAVLAHDGLTVVVTERKMPMWNLQQLRSLGIEPTSMRIVVVKAAIAHRAAYDPIACRTIYASTPGITDLDIRRFDYQSVRRPILPLDDNAAYTPSTR
jgi:microcystin degradation protein MlrC